MNGIERRFTVRASDPVAVRSLPDGSRVIRGYAAVFYKPDDPGTRFLIWSDMEERIMPTAFQDALDGKDDPLALFNHDPSKVLGRLASGTLKIGTDERGLWYEITPPDTDTGREVVALLERGDIRGSSFAFVPTETVERKEVRNGRPLYVSEVTRCKLYDVGPVTYPAYSGTDAGVRSTGADAAALRDKLRGRVDGRAHLDAIDVALAAMDDD